MKNYRHLSQKKYSSDFYFFCLAPSSSAIKVFSSAFERPHAVEELECCAIINLSNGVPSYVWPQKAIFCQWSWMGEEKQSWPTSVESKRACRHINGDKTAGTHRWIRRSNFPHYFQKCYQQKNKLNKVSFVLRQNAHRVSKEKSACTKWMDKSQIKAGYKQNNK